MRKENQKSGETREKERARRTGTMIRPRGDKRHWRHARDRHGVAA
ncbi:hypothetical protein STXM2123_4176 [Streptomyces sp. F-3]|nr:hypothetical protein STXM2123_4176 [Streptomyces sp. F-3]